jgi:hypothetical protein
MNIFQKQKKLYENGTTNIRHVTRKLAVGVN